MPNLTVELVSAWQLAATNDGVYVLDDQGTVWRYSHLTRAWEALPLIPRPEEPVSDS